MAQRIAPLGWHLEMHLEPDELATFSEVIGGLPLPVVIDHMARIGGAGGVAQPAFQVLLDIVRRDNGWVKISGLERHAADFQAMLPLARALLDAAPDRVVWGSNYPHPKSLQKPDDAVLLDLVPRFAPDPAVQRRLLVDNPARLYDF